MVKIAVVGAGGWGINHVRAFARAKGAQLLAVADLSEAAINRAAGLAPTAAGDHESSEPHYNQL